MLSATTVILMFLGSEGGAVENVHSLLARMVSPEGKINVYFFQSARAFPDSHWIERTKICRRIQKLNFYIRIECTNYLVQPE